MRANGRHFVETERNWARSIANYKAIYGRAWGVLCKGTWLAFATDVARK
jgi:hypothetical protein